MNTMTLTVEEIKDLAEFSGLRIHGDGLNEDEKATEITISSWPQSGVLDDDCKTPLPPHKHVAHYEEYPEEGVMPLGSPIPQTAPCS